MHNTSKHYFIMWRTCEY